MREEFLHARLKLLREQIAVVPQLRRHRRNVNPLRFLWQHHNPLVLQSLPLITSARDDQWGAACLDELQRHPDLRPHRPFPYHTFAAVVYVSQLRRQHRLHGVARAAEDVRLEVRVCNAFFDGMTSPHEKAQVWHPRLEIRRRGGY